MCGNENVLPEPSRETKFSGVHKDNCAARGFGARTRVDAISNGASKAGGKAGPLRAGSRAETRAPRAN